MVSVAVAVAVAVGDVDNDDDVDDDNDDDDDDDDDFVVIDGIFVVGAASGGVHDIHILAFRAAQAVWRTLEYSCFSQTGDDGLLMRIFGVLGWGARRSIEIGGHQNIMHVYMYA